MSLESNEFVDREGNDFAVEIVGDNPNLEQFDWINNSIESMEDARCLVAYIISHPNIVDVRLENCCGEGIDGYEILLLLLESDKRFSTIDFDTNNMQTGDYIATNTSLDKLYLNGNHITDDDAVFIAEALKQNTNLRYLSLGNNDITHVGRGALSSATYDSTTLNSLVGCNHSCFIAGVDLVDRRSHLNKYTYARTLKLYNLLSFRNREGSNVHHLSSEFDIDEDENSLVLVPRVLESVYRYSERNLGYHDFDRVHPLSIMYEILRSWKMPALYENGGRTRN